MGYDILGYSDPVTFGSDDTNGFGGGDVNFSQQDATILQGNNNSLPVQSDTDYQGASSILQKLGSVDYVKTARDIGTAVGTIKNQASQIKGAYNAAEMSAASGNKLGTWWQYSSTTDKLVVGIAAVTLIVALSKG